MKSIVNQSNYSLPQQKTLVISALLLFIFFALTAPLQAQVQQLSASVDRNTVLLDESMQLTLVAEGSAARDAVDFSPLQKNFRVSQPSFAQSTQIINGAMSRTVTWTVNLYPKQTGTFTIPSFTVEGKSSRQFNVRVLPIDNSAGGQPREFYVTSSIDNQEIYLQQQILYTVKIHLSRDIQRGQLTQPDLEGAIVEQIGEDQDYQEIIDGVRYRIIERKYAIIPQASGDFTISGPMFEAEVPTNSRRSFANFGRSENIARRAPDIDINIRPIPDNYNYTWLPSERVEIAEQWQGNTEPFAVGEPVTRTITLTALGLTKEQLPSIDLPYHPSFKVYPEQANLATVERNNRLIAQGVFNSAIIPEEAGKFVMPEARIPWFNVNTGQTEFAILPARSIEVIAKPNSAKTPLQSAPPPAQQVPSNQNNEALIDSVSSSQTSGLNWLHYLLIASNILSLVAFFVYILMNKHKPKMQSSSTPVSRPLLNEEAAFMKLKNLLEQGKLTGTNEAFETWLKQLFGDRFYSVSACLASQPETQALEAYNSIQAQRFSENEEELDFRHIITCLSQFRQKAQASTSTNALATLYP